MENASSLINEISAHDRVLGEISFEAHQASEQNMPIASLACLFILVEQTIRYHHENFDDNLKHLINKSELLNEKDKDLLENIRYLRNNIFHAFHHGTMLTDGQRVLCLNETDDLMHLFNQLFRPCLKIILKLLDNPP
jgi:hypothetical protein